VWPGAEVEARGNVVTASLVCASRGIYHLVLGNPGCPTEVPANERFGSSFSSDVGVQVEFSSFWLIHSNTTLGCARQRGALPPFPFARPFFAPDPNPKNHPTNTRPEQETSKGSQWATAQCQGTTGERQFLCNRKVTCWRTQHTTGSPTSTVKTILQHLACTQLSPVPDNRDDCGAHDRAGATTLVEAAAAAMAARRGTDAGPCRCVREGAPRVRLPLLGRHSAMYAPGPGTAEWYQCDSVLHAQKTTRPLTTPCMLFSALSASPLLFASVESAGWRASHQKKRLTRARADWKRSLVTRLTEQG